MTPAGLKDYRDRTITVAVKLKVAGRDVEAGRWRAVADRYDALLAQDMPMYGGVS